MTNGTAWAGAVVGSMIGSTVTAYIVSSDDDVRTKLTFAVPFLLLASIGVIELLREPPPPTTKLKLVPFQEN